MTRMVIMTGHIIGSLLAATAVANSKPHDIRIELKLETVAAIHVPTGCVSAVEYDDGAFVQAFITDPLCLPNGVSKRFVPASGRDFYSIDPKQASVTSQ